MGDALDFDDEDNTEFLDDEDEESDLPAGRESDDEGELESDQDEDSYFFRKAWRNRHRHLRNLKRHYRRGKRWVRRARRHVCRVIRRCRTVRFGWFRRIRRTCRKIRVC